MPPPQATAAVLATTTFLNSLRAIPNLPRDSWYYLSSVTFALLNRPAEIPRIFEHALDSSSSVAAAAATKDLEHESGYESAGSCGGDKIDGIGSMQTEAGAGAGPNAAMTMTDESAVVIFNKTREALLKAAAIGGLPKTINALNSLKAHPSAVPLLDLPSPTTRTADLARAPEEVLARGDDLWRTVYGKVSTRVMGGMRRGYEDLGVVAQVLYGHVLSEQSVLAPKETSWCLCVGLVAEGVEVAPQLKGHLRGAINNGATRDEVRAVRGLAMRILRECGRLDDDSESRFPDL